MIYIALGANRPLQRRLPAENLSAALGWLSERGCRPVQASRCWRTPAWPDPSDPAFVNAAAQVEWAGAAGELLALLHAAETAFGRRRTVRNAPRTLDLDLIDFDGRLSGDPALELPHPRLCSRAFVLLPLHEIAPGWRHPQSGEPIARLIARLPLADRRAARPFGMPLVRRSEAP